MSIKNRLLSGGMWVIAGRAITAITGLLTNMMLARLLSPEQFGIYFLTLSLVLLFSVVGQFGLNRAVFRLLATALAEKDNAQIRAVVTSVLLWAGIGTTILTVLLISGIGDWVTSTVFSAPAMIPVIKIIAIWAFFHTFTTLFAEIFRAFHNIRSATLYSGVITKIIITIGLSAIWLQHETTSISNVLILTGLATTISAIIAGFFLIKKIYHFPRAPLLTPKLILSAAFPLLITNIMILAVGELHIWILAMYRPESDVALYGASYRLLNLLLMPLLIVNLVIPSTVAELYAKKELVRMERILRIAATGAGLPAIIVLAMFVVAGTNILNLVYGEYYTDAANVLTILALAQAACLWVGSPGLLLVMAGKEKIIMRITLISGMFGILVTLYYVALLGPTGVAIGVSSGLLLQNFLPWLYCRIKLKIRTNMSIEILRYPEVLAQFHKIRGFLTRSKQ